jgi:hypothetical protein
MSLSSDLAELAALHKQGALTDAEFKDAKAKLLKRADRQTAVGRQRDTSGLQERIRDTGSTPHPMRVVASTFLIAAAIAAAIFATVVPYRYNVDDYFKGGCSGPLFELFQRERNPNYDPNYVYIPSSDAGEYDEFFDRAGKGSPTEKFLTNFCVDGGKPRLIGSTFVLFASILVLGNLWRTELARYTRTLRRNN